MRRSVCGGDLMADFFVWKKEISECCESNYKYKAIRLRELKIDRTVRRRTEVFRR